MRKIFDALRPAAALRWLRFHPGEAVAPMHFPTLLNECDPSAKVKEIVADLLSKKSVTCEFGAVPLPKPIGAFIGQEFELARAGLPSGRPSISPNLGARAEAFFHSTVVRLDQQSRRGQAC